ncbi:hypothetical protein CDV55_100931 [Aspergillus turcosus]|nr:hypothetical protein CDV55_100931 [Aspergillus turcosus]
MLQFVRWQSVSKERNKRDFSAISNAPDTFGKDVVDAVYAADAGAIVHDTKKQGRPDLVRLTWDAVQEFQAEAVTVISNEKLTKKVVYGMETRGVPAYGAIWDIHPSVKQDIMTVSSSQNNVIPEHAFLVFFSFSNSDLISGRRGANTAPYISSVIMRVGKTTSRLDWNHNHFEEVGSCTLAEALIGNGKGDLLPEGYEADD